MTTASIIKAYKANLLSDLVYFAYEYRHYRAALGDTSTTNLIVQANQQYYIHNEHTLSLACNPQFAFVNCTFVIDYSTLKRELEEPTTFVGHSFSNCTFILLNDNRGLQDEVIVLDCHMCFYGDGSATYRVYNKADLMVKTNDGERSRVCNHYCAINNKYKDILSIQNVTDKLAQVKYSLIGKDNVRVVKYRDRTYEFSKTSVAIGLELEFPVDSELVKLDNRQWLFDTDGSQLTGDLEAVSVPMSLSYINGQKLEQNLGKLWKRLVPHFPSSLDCWSKDKQTNSSGIHIHYSWDENNLPISNMELWEAMHSIVEKRGGEKYLLTMGGKSLSAFQAYSAYCKPSVEKYGEKYVYINCVCANHVELRFGANHPDQLVVQERIRNMTRLFTESVELALVAKVMNVARLQLMKKCAKV